MLFPTTEGKVLKFNGVAQKRDYYRALRSAGLDLIGHERWDEIPGELTQPIWTQFDQGKHDLEIEHVWAGIAHSLRQKGEAELSDVAKQVGFALRTSGLRARDCSAEYQWQNSYAVNQKTKPGGRFSNMKSFDLDMALHSLLVEMGTARDYLARFISRQILREETSVDAMAKLHERLKAGKVQAQTPEAQQVVNSVLTICDQASPDGWMARLGRFRNLIVHRAPLASLRDGQWITAQTIAIGQASAFQINYLIPSDPLIAEAVGQVDALTHFLGLQRRLREFARLVAEATGIKPTMQHFTDKDFVRAPS
jgi:hypothetical protein